MIKPDINKILNSDSIKAMIIGNDLDSLLSASLLKSRFGWNVVGIFDYQSMWYDSNYSNADFFKNLKLQKYLAVDLDIYRNCLPSIRHHILSVSKNDILPQHEMSLNPNLINGITHQNFKQKYPMGMVHYLMHILNEYPTLSRLGELLLWLADSTFINAQTHRFRDNMNYWLKHYVPNRVLKNGFDKVDSLLFEQKMEKLVFPALEKTGIVRGKGQVRSKHKNLQGYQCQWENPNENQKSILSLLKLIYKNTNWEIPKLPISLNEIRGKRITLRFTKQDESKKGFLRNFLAEKKVFSYVITNRYLINYTTGIDY